MAKRKNSRKPKLRFYLINVKLRSKKRGGKDAYVQLFEDLFKLRMVKKTEGDKAIIIRTMHRKEIGEDFMLTGHLTKFTNVEGRDWVNISNFEIEQPNVPTNIFPNPKEVMYYFVPSVHRFALKVDPSLSPNTVVSFLERALSEVIQPDEQIEVMLEQSSDVFDKIYKASQVSRLEITITYTNADQTANAEKWFDDELRDSNIGVAKLTFKADPQESIKVVGNTLVEGALSLAQNNGSVKASIVDSEDNRKKTVETTLHPKSDEVETTLEDNLLPALFNKIKNAYPRDGNE